MTFDKTLIAAKLRRWEKYLDDYRLPLWEDIPDFGLYMEQVVTLLHQYLDYLPPELKDEQIITAAAINNYVRKRVMPAPVKKKYYRSHIACLIIICSMKQSLSIATLQTVIPADLTEDELRRTYDGFVERHHRSCVYFCSQVRAAAAGILGHDGESELSTGDTGDLIISAAVVSGFARLLAEKLLLLDGRTPADVEDGEKYPSRQIGADSGTA